VHAYRPAASRGEGHLALDVAGDRSGRFARGRHGRAPATATSNQSGSRAGTRDDIAHALACDGAAFVKGTVHNIDRGCAASRSRPKAPASPSMSKAPNRAQLEQIQTQRGPGQRACPMARSERKRPQNAPKSMVVDTSRRARKPLQTGAKSARAAVWIAPRRSGVRVPLAPLGSRPVARAGGFVASVSRAVAWLTRPPTCPAISRRRAAERGARRSPRTPRLPARAAHRA
jgi:hypothetical protein